MLIKNNKFFYYLPSNKMGTAGFVVLFSATPGTLWHTISSDFTWRSTGYIKLMCLEHLRCGHLKQLSYHVRDQKVHKGVFVNL